MTTIYGFTEVDVQIEDTRVTIFDQNEMNRLGEDDEPLKIILATFEVKPTDWQYNLDEGDSMPCDFKLVRTT